MAGMFKKATRKRTRLRLGLCGPSGAGKTYTGLRLAFALAEARGKEEGRPGRVAVIDSESGSASKYAGESPDGVPWNFDVVELVNFSPDRYTEALGAAGVEKFDVVLVDSLSHAWEGKDGALEMVDRKAGQSQSGNSFTAWKEVTPMHRRMVEALLTCPCDVICTLRAKTEYVIQENEKGKKVPVKIGVGAIQRSGMEYEFDVFGELDQSHILTVTKTRCSALDGVSVVKPGPGFAAPLIAWLMTGEVVEVGQASVKNEDAAERTRLVEAIMLDRVRIGWDAAKFGAEVMAKYARPIEELSLSQLAEFAARLARLPDKKRPAPVTETVDIPARSATDSQLSTIKALKTAMDTLVPTVADQRALWKELLANYKATSARELKEPDAALFIKAVEHRIEILKQGGDPFTNPPGKAAEQSQPQPQPQPVSTPTPD